MQTRAAAVNFVPDSDGVLAGAGGPAAVVMAGGYGKRLGPLTRELPKPMVPVAGRPALEHVVEHLDSYGISNAAFALHYLPHVIQNHFGPRRGGVQIRHAVCESDMGTAGGVLLASRLVHGDPLLVVSGDVLSDLDIGGMMAAHAEHGGPFTMALAHVEDVRPYGLVQLDSRGRIRGFEEKPDHTPDGGAWINAGIYILGREVLSRIPHDRPYDISRDLVPQLMREGIDLHGFRHDGHWFDIGTPPSLQEAEAYLGTVATNLWVDAV